MSVSQPSLTVQTVAAAKSRTWIEPLLGLAAGVLGGAIQSKILSAPMSHSILLGGIFGLAFSLLFARRATTPGAGLIWGLGGALLLWFVMPTGIDLLLLRSASSTAMLNDAQERFPQLVAYLVCLGMPVGVVLGVRGSLRTKKGQLQFRWGRAVVAGGLAGTIGGLAFSGWEFAGGYLPLLEGLPDFQSQARAVIMHFLVALLIGAIFGILFQRDVRGYGSSMGWGLGFGIFLWFFGPLTVFPIVGGQPLDWSAEQGTAVFGSLVGYIVYGFILGTIYAFLDQRCLAAACRITLVIISWTHRRNCVRPHRIINRWVVGHQEVDLRGGNTGHQCSQRLGEPDWIFAPQGADDISDVG